MVHNSIREARVSRQAADHTPQSSDLNFSAREKSLCCRGRGSLSSPGSVDRSDRRQEVCSRDREANGYP
jgi:hypothetical protein